jgi:predicted AAA+ superfamily ATPase
MYGLTMRELGGRIADEPFIDRLARADISLFRVPTPTPDITAYIETALKSAFPDVLLTGLSDAARERWLDSYVEQLLTHDVPGTVRAPERLRRYFEALAINSAGLPKEETLYTAAGIDHKTAKTYQDLLTAVYVLDVVPSFENQRLARMVKMPKRYVVDAGLMAVALRIDSRAVLRDSALVGRVIDTFVMGQLRPETELSKLRPRFYHLREEHGRREVDIVGDLANGVIGVEVKATAAPSSNDAAHLIHLRDRLGDKFLAGALLHTGPRPFQLSERIFALPVSTLWG